jgi:hypothetical protein
MGNHVKIDVKKYPKHFKRALKKVNSKKMKFEIHPIEDTSQVGIVSLLYLFV